MSGFVMLAALLAVALAAVASALHRTQRRQADRERAQADAARAALEAEVAAAARLVTEDVNRLAEDLRELEVAAAVTAPEVAQRERMVARDACDRARGALTTLRRHEQIAQVSRTLARGRYALACARARIHGRPAPERRPPCFFNPAHGPSCTTVWWPRTGLAACVPACRADGERVAAGAEPFIRTVPVGAERVPYWQGGPAYEPYVVGYFGEWEGLGTLPSVLGAAGPDGWTSSRATGQPSGRAGVSRQLPGHPGMHAARGPS